MNISLCRLLVVPLMTVMLVACSSGPSGDYGGADCGLYDKLSFRDNGKVYISMKLFGVQMAETAGDYIVDEDRVVVTANNQSTVFTLNDDGDLESSMLGEKIVCRKGGGDGDSASSKLPGSLSASYGGMACMLDRMTFSKDGNVILVVDDESQPGTYRMSGNQVEVTVKGDSLMFTLNGNDLVTTIEGHRTICSKL